MSQTNGATKPTIDIPRSLPSDFQGILIGGDLKELAEGMSQTDANALLIQIFRQNSEIVKFVRDIAGLPDAMRAMMPAMGSGLIKPRL